MSTVDNMPVTGKRAPKPDPARSGSVPAQGEKPMLNPWPSDRILKLLGIDLPILQAPMTGATTSAMAICVAQAGGLGSIAAAMLSLNQVRAELGAIRAKIQAPINLNFFCHANAIPDPARETAWRHRLRAYYIEHALDPEKPTAALSIAPLARHSAISSRS